MDLKRISDEYIRQTVQRCYIEHLCDSMLACHTRKLALGETFTSTDQDKIRSIVRSELKDKVAERVMQEIAINVVLSLFRTLYLKRGIYRNELKNAP